MSHDYYKAMNRPSNFNQLDPESQWMIDKELGILDWNGDCPHQKDSMCEPCKKAYRDSHPREIPRTTTKAFTLIELLVCIAILAILIGIAIPAIHNREKSAQQQKSPQPVLPHSQAYDQEKARQRAEQRRQEQEQIAIAAIQKEIETEKSAQQEYLPKIQPLSFIVTNWQLNRQENLKVFVLYDTQNKQEYLVVQNVNHPEFMTITPRIKNER